jgi:two-component system response regulator PilR (NtrC family)
MKENILIADDERDIRESLALVLQGECYNCITVENGEEAINELEKSNIDVLITDIMMPKMDGLQVLQKTTEISPQTIVIVITAYASVESAVGALRNGASDYVIKPLDFDEVIFKINQFLEHRETTIENKYLRSQIDKRFNYDNIVGKSKGMQEVFSMIERVSPANSNILITGQTGTGKELVARAIHKNSPRTNKPFIPVNCGAIPENLYESEFFGYKKGSFTGATTDHDGLFKSANNGTIFLDEIGDLPEHMQIKLLRVLQEKEIRPVGSSSEFKVDFRLIAATNKNLAEEVQNGNFREDLFYRLNVIEIKLPALKDRKDDIPLLVNHFIKIYNEELKRSIKGVDNEVMKIFLNYEWKGNLRELENLIERAVLLCENDYITIKEIPSYIIQKTEIADEVPVDLNDALDNFEKSHIIKVLMTTNWNRTEAAKLLGIDFSTLYRKMVKYSIIESAHDQNQEQAK